MYVTILRSGLVSGLLVFLTVPVLACQDAEDSPLAVAVAPETHGALLLSDHMPSVPHLLSEQGLGLEGAAEANAWWESWTLDDAAGEDLRASVYPAAASRLYPRFGEEGVRGLLDQQQESLTAVEKVSVIIASPTIAEALGEANRLHATARQALEEGQGQQALALVLCASDALWEVSPQQVATQLVTRASQGLRRIQGSRAYSEEELLRIRRLGTGAEEAFKDGDYSLAIRRAYYACQLLGVDPP